MVRVLVANSKHVDVARSQDLPSPRLPIILRHLSSIHHPRSVCSPRWCWVQNRPTRCDRAFTMSATSDHTGSPSPTPEDASIFNKWSRKFSVVTGIGITEEERLRELETHQHNMCNRWKRELMNYSPAVVFMLKRLEQSGCPVAPKHLSCQPCSFDRSGGFVPGAGITILCQGRFWSKTHMEHTLVHELVHMYDQCMFKVDWSNLRHHACSEIRANSLSGDCKWTRELRRGFFSFTKQHQACVRRRAILSVAANPACPDTETAEKAVNSVWDSCFQDTRPFDEIY